MARRRARGAGGLLAGGTVRRKSGQSRFAFGGADLK